MSVRFLFYLFEIDRDGDPLEAAPVLESRTLPPAVGAVDRVRDRVPVFVVQIVAHLFQFKKNKSSVNTRNSRVYVHFYRLALN